MACLARPLFSPPEVFLALACVYTAVCLLHFFFLFCFRVGFISHCAPSSAAYANVCNVLSIDDCCHASLVDIAAVSCLCDNHGRHTLHPHTQTRNRCVLSSHSSSCWLESFSSLRSRCKSQQEAVCLYSILFYYLYCIKRRVEIVLLLLSPSQFREWLIPSCCVFVCLLWLADWHVCFCVARSFAVAFSCCASQRFV